MNSEIYDSWKKRRAEARVPEGFSGCVMEQVAARETERRTVASWLMLVALPRLGQTVVCLLAALVGLARMGQVMSALIP